MPLANKPTAKNEWAARLVLFEFARLLLQDPVFKKCLSHERAENATRAEFAKLPKPRGFVGDGVRGDNLLLQMAARTFCEDKLVGNRKFIRPAESHRFGRFWGLLDEMVLAGQPGAP